MKTLRVHYEGRVQGVGFRYTTLQIAKEFEVAGVVRNLADGRVHLEVEGRAADVAVLVACTARGLGLHPVEAAEMTIAALLHASGALADATLANQTPSLARRAAAPKAVAFCSGSGYSAVPELLASGVDTLVTGELREDCFNRAQEEKLNLYLCGHYATEVHGVKALAVELSKKFKLPWEFIGTENPF